MTSMLTGINYCTPLLTADYTVSTPMYSSTVKAISLYSVYNAARMQPYDQNVTLTQLCAL
jgi:hypothetical protein